MIRWVGIALVIWGLIVQPLMAAVPAKMINNNTDTTVSLNVGLSDHIEGHARHHIQKANEATKAACHEGAADGRSSSGTCGNCEVDCINSSSCASLCVLSGVTVNREPMVIPEPQITMAIPPKTNHIGFDFHSRIYHPPQTFLIIPLGTSAPKF